MHLFASFMVRAFTFLLKNLLFVSGVGLSTDVLIKNGESYWLTDKFESNWHCKAFTSIWQYCILANYSWILMEGLYLHNLIFCALFADSNASISVYVVLGWGESVKEGFYPLYPSGIYIYTLSWGLMKLLSWD